jgi:hypothetical protein
MKHTLIILLCLACSGWARGQTPQTPLSLISTAGGTGTVEINLRIKSVEWTIGETFIGTGVYTSNSMVITMGEQQAFPTNWPPVGIEETIFRDVKVFPNPASAYVKIENLPAGKNTLTLTDLAGRELQKLTTSESNQIIATKNLPAGNYLLMLERKKNQQVTFKIIITNN